METLLLGPTPNGSLIRTPRALPVITFSVTVTLLLPPARDRAVAALVVIVFRVNVPPWMPSAKIPNSLFRLLLDTSTLKWLGDDAVAKRIGLLRVWLVNELFRMTRPAEFSV